MALFGIPFIVILGWILGRPITMLFDPFESITLFLSVLTVNHVAQNEKSNWLEGMILICLCVKTLRLLACFPSGADVLHFCRYIIVAVVSWFYPGTEPTGLLACSA